MAEAEGRICGCKVVLPEVVGSRETRYFCRGIGSKASAVVDIKLGEFEGRGAGDGWGGRLGRLGVGLGGGLGV